jgi:Cu-Zn family superoxide dismutase
VPTEETTMNSFWVLIAGAALVLAGCADMPSLRSMGSGAAAEAVLEPTKGSNVRGTVSFAQKGDKVRMVAKLSGLPRAGGHGFHLHEKGDCSSGDGMSAGGHFNPLGKPHAHHAVVERHAGDLPMLVADGNGNAELAVDMDVIAVGSGATDVIGRAVIVHKDADDYKTQPTGNAGARLACGIVRRK